LSGEFSPYRLGTYLSKVFSEFEKINVAKFLGRNYEITKKNRGILVLYQIELNPFVADHHFV
jgi:hypothetical protein